MIDLEERHIFCLHHSSTHLLTSAGLNPYEVAKTRVQLQFLCSTYRSDKLCRHWTPSNPNGFCTFSPCWYSSEVETSEHILLLCPPYQTTRLQLYNSAVTPWFHSSPRGCSSVTAPWSRHLWWLVLFWENMVLFNSQRETKKTLPLELWVTDSD